MTTIDAVFAREKLSPVWGVLRRTPHDPPLAPPE
jgi:hypothetical protein